MWDPKIRYLIFSLLFTFLIPAGAANTEEPTLPSSFYGQWQSDGDAFGQTALSLMTWTVDLNGRFSRLDYKIKMNQGTNKETAFIGVAYYKPGENNMFTAFWADNTGDLHPIKATLDGHTLWSIWGVEGKKLGRTRYEIIAPEVMQVTDWIKTGEAWQQFNNNTFIRLDETN